MIRNRWHGRVCIVFFTAFSAIAADLSYVVLNRSETDSLVRMSAGGQSFVTIADHAGGYGLAKDKQGDYVVAAVTSLLRVTPSGGVSTIARAPKGSQWMAVVQSREGAFVVIDNQQHAVWRVSEDGRSIIKVVHYSGASPNMEDTGIVLDDFGNYLVIENEDKTHLWRITPGGQVTSVLLQGVASLSAGFIAPSGDGNYFIASSRDRAIFRLTRDGIVTKFAGLRKDDKNVTGMVQNPATGQVIMTANFAQALLRISADGLTVSRLVTDSRYLTYPTAILVESVP